jgi:hypothetical protein
MLRLAGIAATVLAAFVAVPDARAPGPLLHLRVFAATGIPLTDVAWTGSSFLYVENTTNRIWAAPATGAPARLFATMPKQVEETRCRVSPGSHGWPKGALFCHAPQNAIYRIDPGGDSVRVFASLPEPRTADGALAFDRAGGFGYRLLAATGRSGAGQAGGGNVYAIDPRGTVTRIGGYHDPGGADQALVAPAAFGTASRALLLAVDAGPTGRVVAVAPGGRSRTIATLPDGPNPIVTIGAGEPAHGAAVPGLYVTDTLSKNVYLAPAAELERYRGAVLVGSELRARFWILRPRGAGFAVLAVPTTLRGKNYNLEGAVYLAP